MNVDSSGDALERRRGGEVDERPEGKVEQAQVSQQLVRLDRPERFHRVQFDRQHPTGQEVDVKAIAKTHAIKLEWHERPALDDQSAEIEETIE